MDDRFCRETRLTRNFPGSLTCRKSATWDRRLYFPSEGRHAENFFARKIRRLRPGLNPRSWVPEASTLTTRPPKPLLVVVPQVASHANWSRMTSNLHIITYCMSSVFTHIYKLPKNQLLASSFMYVRSSPIHLYVCLSKWNDSAPTWQISMKVIFEYFLKLLVYQENSSFITFWQE